MPKFVIPGKTSRADLALAAAGVLSQTADPGLYNTTGSPATQQVYGALLGLRAGDVVTGIVLRLSVAAVGTAPTTARFGIADSSGVVLALSGNLNAAANWTLGAPKFAFAAPYTVTADGGYYACVVVNGTWGSTQPVTMRLSGTPAITLAVAGAAAPGFSWAGQTDLPAVASSLTLTAGAALSFYMAFY